MRALLIVWLCVVNLASARAEDLIVSLSSQHIDITSTYNGAILTLFGVVTRDGQTATRNQAYDVLITVKGPSGLVTVRRKEPLGPIWLNRDQGKFADVPAMLALVSTRPHQEMVDPEFMNRFGMTLESHILPKGSPLSDEFGAALIRLKQKERLYDIDASGVAFITPDVFRAALAVPAIAPMGVYQIEVALFAGGVRLARAETFFTVGKVGFEQLIAREARDHSLLYGMATAAMALCFGWLASVIFRRD
jgi:uncharacterized protein (TIGR02186 family)